MRQPPPVPGGALLSSDHLKATGLDAAVMAAMTLGAFGITQSRSGDSLRASTVAFSTLSFGQLLYALACRSDEHPGVRRLGDNPALAAGLGGMLAMQAATVVVPPLRSLLGTTPLGLADVVLVGAGATVPLLVREAIKTMQSAEPMPGGRHG
jgi:Ca2+-transporting ATPase